MVEAFQVKELYMQKKMACSEWCKRSELQWKVICMHKVVSGRLKDWERQQNIGAFYVFHMFTGLFQSPWHMNKAYNHMLAKKL